MLDPELSCTSDLCLFMHMQLIEYMQFNELRSVHLLKL